MRALLKESFGLDKVDGGDTFSFFGAWGKFLVAVTIIWKSGRTLLNTNKINLGGLKITNK